MVNRGRYRRWWHATAPFSSVEALRGFSENKRQVIVKTAPGEWWEQEMKKHPLCFLFLSPQPLSVAKEVCAKDSAYYHE